MHANKIQIQVILVPLEKPCAPSSIPLRLVQIAQLTAVVAVVRAAINTSTGARLQNRDGATVFTVEEEEVGVVGLQCAVGVGGHGAVNLLVVISYYYMLVIDKE